MAPFEWALIVAAVAIVCVMIWELYRSWQRSHGGYGAEGFTTLRDVITSTIPRRYDVTLDDDLSEEPDYKRDRRYFAGYVDVQRLGVANDFCRVVERSSTNSSKAIGQTFMACALAGTENLDSYEFRTPTVTEGLTLSRDDYMRALVAGAGADYCRILKDADKGSWHSMCNPVGSGGFSADLVQDTSPPPDTEQLLRFFEGILVWFRFHDDMFDYAQNVRAMTAGKLTIDETPSRRDTPPINGEPMSQGLQFNGADQYMRIGENSQLQLGFAVPMRTIRAFSMWVRWDAFTNWAHIFDFGDGDNTNSTWMGIEAKGNPGIDSAGSVQPPMDVSGGVFGGMLAAQVNEVCTAPTHVVELSPQELMLTSSSNVDAYACPLPDTGVVDGNGKSIVGQTTAKPAPRPPTANLIFEIWDAQQRKMRISVVDFFTLGVWTHVALTVTGTDSQRPTWNLYKNGNVVYTQADGWLPQSNLTSHNYIGRSNDETPATQFADKTERFKGSLYDFRVYQVPMTQQLITETIQWGKDALFSRPPVTKGKKSISAPDGTGSTK